MKIKKVQGFWNDSEGISIVEFVTVSFTMIFLLVAISSIILSNKGGTETRIEVLRILTQPVLVILGGFFVDKSVSNFATPKKEVEEKEKEKPTI